MTPLGEIIKTIYRATGNSGDYPQCLFVDYDLWLAGLDQLQGVCKDISVRSAPHELHNFLICGIPVIPL